MNSSIKNSKKSKGKGKGSSKADKITMSYDKTDLAHITKKGARWFETELAYGR